MNWGLATAPGVKLPLSSSDRRSGRALAHPRMSEAERDDNHVSRARACDAREPDYETLLRSGTRLGVFR